MGRPKKTPMTKTTIFSLLLVACPGPTTPEPTPDRDVGAACTEDAQCKDGLTCDTRLPGGVCTKACTMAGECPTASQCVNLTYSVSGTLMSEPRCVKECSELVTCRSGWRCVRAEPEPFSVCVPGSP